MSCWKVGYKDRIAAMLALAKCRKGSGARNERRAYHCGDCGQWHLTSRDEKNTGKNKERDRLNKLRAIMS